MPQAERLEDRLRRDRTLPVEWAIRIAYQVGELVMAAHDAGLVHGSLSPAAIVLESEARASVDFKGARTTDATPADDVSGLGAVLYQMLAGQRTTAFFLVTMLRPETPDAVATLIASMLATEPSARPAMGEVIRQLAPFYKLPDPEADAIAQLHARPQQHAPTWHEDDARMNDPIGLGLGPPVDASAPAKPPDVALLEAQLTDQHYAIRFKAWDGLVEAFGLGFVVRAPPGNEGKGSYMELLKDFLASDCDAFVRIGADEIRGVLAKLRAGATPASLGIEWQPDAVPDVIERAWQAMRDPDLAYPVEELSALTGIARRWAEAALAMGVEEGNERALDVLVRLAATWTVPILEELARSPASSLGFRNKLADAIRELKVAWS